MQTIDAIHGQIGEARLVVVVEGRLLHTILEAGDISCYATREDTEAEIIGQLGIGNLLQRAPIPLDIPEMTGHILVAATRIVKHIGRLCPQAVSRLHDIRMTSHNELPPVSQMPLARYAFGVIVAKNLYLGDIHLDKDRTHIKGRSQGVTPIGKPFPFHIQHLIVIIPLLIHIPFGNRKMRNLLILV